VSIQFKHSVIKSKQFQHTTGGRQNQVRVLCRCGNGSDPVGVTFQRSAESKSVHLNYQRGKGKKKGRKKKEKKRERGGGKEGERKEGERKEKRTQGERKEGEKKKRKKKKKKKYFSSNVNLRDPHPNTPPPPPHPNPSPMISPPHFTAEEDKTPDMSKDSVSLLFGSEGNGINFPGDDETLSFENRNFSIEKYNLLSTPLQLQTITYDNDSTTKADTISETLELTAPTTPALPFDSSHNMYDSENLLLPVPEVQSPSFDSEIPSTLSDDQDQTEQLNLFYDNKPSYRKQNVEKSSRSADKDYGYKLFTCEECGSTFKRTHDLKRHQKSLHSGGQKDFFCFTCPKSFARIDALKRHVSRPGSECFVKLGGGMSQLHHMVNTHKRNKNDD
jgi:hypothetical protein